MEAIKAVVRMALAGHRVRIWYFMRKRGQRWTLAGAKVNAERRDRQQHTFFCGGESV
jgi:hypothetical protein